MFDLKEFAQEGGRTGGTENYSEALADKLAELMMADQTTEEETAFPHPRCFEEVYPAEDMTASNTASAAASDSFRCGSAEARGVTFGPTQEDSVGWIGVRVGPLVATAAGMPSLAPQPKSSASFGRSPSQTRSRELKHPSLLVLEHTAVPPCLRICFVRAPLSTVVHSSTLNDALAAAHGTKDGPRTREQLLQGAI